MDIFEEQGTSRWKDGSHAEIKCPQPATFRVSIIKLTVCQDLCFFDVLVFFFGSFQEWQMMQMATMVQSLCIVDPIPLCSLSCQHDKPGWSYCTPFLLAFLKGNNASNPQQQCCNQFTVIPIGCNSNCMVAFGWLWNHVAWFVIHSNTLCPQLHWAHQDVP